MKFLIVSLYFFAVFALFFFLLSLFGALWFPYKEVIQSQEWFAGYLTLFGWWIAGFAAYELDEKMSNL